MQIEITITLDGTELLLVDPVQRLLLAIAGGTVNATAQIDSPAAAELAKALKRGNGAKPTEVLPLPPVDETPDMLTKPTEPVATAKPKPKPKSTDYSDKSEAEKGDIARSIILQVYGVSPAGKDAVRALRRTLKVAKLDDAPSEILLTHAVQLAAAHKVELPAA